jgi:hypothetical protein
MGVAVGIDLGTTSAVVTGVKNGVAAPPHQVDRLEAFREVIEHPQGRNARHPADGAHVSA